MVLTDRALDRESMVERQLRRRGIHDEDVLDVLDAFRAVPREAFAERYDRAMNSSPAESWNLRDRHMFETLLALMEAHGPGASGAVWAHNSHVGDASVTEMAARGELNVGQLARPARRTMP